jgi:hypothetical protein
MPKHKHWQASQAQSGSKAPSMLVFVFFVPVNFDTYVVRPSGCKPPLPGLCKRERNAAREDDPTVAQNRLIEWKMRSPFKSCP